MPGDQANRHLWPLKQPLPPQVRPTRHLRGLLSTTAALYPGLFPSLLQSRERMLRQTHKLAPCFIQQAGKGSGMRAS